jgi:hypothetical protein
MTWTRQQRHKAKGVRYVSDGMPGYIQRGVYYGDDGKPVPKPVPKKPR